MISIKDVCKKFGGFDALSHITCSIPEGCVYGMIGTNGAGKSTFLRLLTGIYKPDSGEIMYDGEPVFNNPKCKESIVFVPDDLYFLPGANMKRMASFYHNIYTRFDMERFYRLTELFGLNPNKPLSNFSKGMRRQTAIILALSTHASYMFFDETFDGLDPVMRNLVRELISEEVSQNKATAIITSHSLKELEDICGQLSLLHKGGLVFESDVKKLKTSLFKVQMAFPDSETIKRLDTLTVVKKKQSGSVVTLILNGQKEEVIKDLKKFSPMFIDVLPLSLEEVFTYETEMLGYEFTEVLGEEN